MPRVLSKFSYQAIEEQAAVIAANKGFDPERDDVRELARNMGGDIEVVDGSDERFVDGGSLVVQCSREFNIYLSKYTGWLRDNFTIAHELGHLSLHVEGPRPGEEITFGRYGDDVFERQANRFAAALLMPKDRFQRVAELVGNDVSALAGRFKVSARAAEVRLQSLKR